MVDLTHGGRAFRRVAGITDALAGHARDDDSPDVFPEQSFALLRASGLTALTVPEHLGGWGGDLAEAATVVSEVAWADASVGLVLGMQYLHAAELFGGEDLAPPVLALGRRIAEQGGYLAGLVSEARSNAPHRGVELAGRADRVPGGWRLNARKTYVTGSRVLTAARVTLAVGGDDGDRQAFLVPFELPGVEIEPTWDAVGLRGSVGHDVLFRDVLVPEDHALGPSRPASVPAAGDPRRGVWWPVLLAAVSVGIAARAVDLIAGGAGVPSLRSRGDADVHWRHLVQAGEAALALQTAVAVLGRAVDEAGRGSLDAATAGGTKLLAHRSATAAVDAVGRLIGTASVWADHPWQRLYRDLRTGLHHAPPDDVVIAALAGGLLDTAGRH